MTRFFTPFDFRGSHVLVTYTYASTVLMAQKIAAKKTRLNELNLMKNGFLD